MGARTATATEAISTRTGAIALPLGVILLVASTAIHPAGDVMDNPAIFRQYADSDGWIAIHFAQWVAGLVFFGGLVALYYAIKARADSGLARLGLVSVAVTAAAMTMLQAVDGVALKWAVDAWASAPVEREAPVFAAAESLRWTEYALQSYSNILLGITLLLFGFAIAFGSAYPRWPGWVAVASGVAWMVHGVMAAYVGLFPSVPRLVALVLLGSWALIMAFLMWRGSGSERNAGSVSLAGPAG